MEKCKFYFIILSSVKSNQFILYVKYIVHLLGLHGLKNNYTKNI